MCDRRTRVWCCHIGLVFCVTVILLSMIFQIWSYYFSLVDEMDHLSYSRPYLGGFVDICHSNVLKSWKIDCVRYDSYFNCSLKSAGSDSDVWVHSSCAGPLENISLSECCDVLVWILPW